MSEYGVDIPSVEEYNRKFAEQIKNEKVNNEILKVKKEIEILKKKEIELQKNFACNKHILDSIAKDTKSYGKSDWIFSLKKCVYDEKITTFLENKGYDVYYSNGQLPFGVALEPKLTVALKK